MQIDALIALGNQVQVAAKDSKLNDATRFAFLEQMAQINAKVTPLEDEFSDALGEISRRTKSILGITMLIVATVLLVIAYIASRRVVQQSERYQQALLASEDQLRSLLQFAPLPIIVVSLPDNRVTYANDHAMAQFNTNMGDLDGLTVQDFYVSIEERARIVEAIRTHGSVRDWEVQLQDKGGKTFWVLLSSRRLVLGGQECLVTALNNIDERKKAQEDLNHRAFHDELTGLPNRAMFMDTLNRTLHRAERKQNGFSILFIDLDHFKGVNDTYGHSVGDLLLQAVATRVRLCVREDDLVARLGGDEFVILIEDEGSESDVFQIARKLQAALEPAHALGEHLLQVTASIGISRYPQDGTGVDDLLRNADSAMYRVKEDGRNNFQFHSTY